MLEAMKYKRSMQQNIDADATRNIAMEMYINEEYKTAFRAVRRYTPTIG